MNTDKLPLVSIAVIAYNSSNTILETLDSAYKQTYPNLELIVSDDCSSDKTLEIVNEWINNHKERFVRTDVVTAKENTGISANYNRAFDACQGEWIKEIDADDLLMPTCIEDFIAFCQHHTEAVYVFGKIKAFGGNSLDCQWVDDKLFDYTFFVKTPVEQLHFLLFERNCIPSPASFYNRQTILQMNFRCDEQFPLLEDYPKWINLLRNGIQFVFMDKVVAMYRINTGVSIGIASPKYYETNRRFCLQYQFPVWLEENKADAYAKLLEHEKNVYRLYYAKEQELMHVRQSRAYRLGKFLLTPFKWLRK